MVDSFKAYITRTICCNSFADVTNLYLFCIFVKRECKEYVSVAVYCLHLSRQRKHVCERKKEW